MRRVAGEHLRLRRRMVVSGRLAPASRTAGTGAAATVLPLHECAVTVHVLASRRAAAGLAAQMVQLMAAGTCACSAAIASAAGADGFGQAPRVAGGSGSMSPPFGQRDLDRGAGRCAGRCPGRSRGRR